MRKKQLPKSDTYDDHVFLMSREGNWPLTIVGNPPPPIVCGHRWYVVETSRTNGKCTTIVTYVTTHLEVGDTLVGYAMSYTHCTKASRYFMHQRVVDMGGK